MAKLKAPLMSLGASGKLGNALVFFGWKGLDVVREYVIPANPKTTAQNTQRGYFTDAVAAVHTAEGVAVNPLDEYDKSAYALKGATYPTPRTWFNTVIKFWVDCKVAVTTPIIFRHGRTVDTSKLDFRPQISISEETGSDLAAGKFYLGTSKTALTKIKTATVAAGDNVSLTVGNGYDDLVAGTKYFWQFRPDAGDLCVGADSGVYYAKAT